MSSSPSEFSKRERQVIEVITRLGRATARDIERELPNAPTYSAVRSILRILTNKGLLLKAPDEEGATGMSQRSLSPECARRCCAIS